MPSTQIKPYCVYCGDAFDLILSEMVPDGTLYPGVQRMCRSTETCILRIHEKYHTEVPSPECEHCDARH